MLIFFMTIKKNFYHGKFFGVFFAHNPKLHDKALKELNKSALFRSDTASES
jgi:hypothetical protein